LDRWTFGFNATVYALAFALLSFFSKKFSICLEGRFFTFVGVWGGIEWWLYNIQQVRLVECTGTDQIPMGIGGQLEAVPSQKLPLLPLSFQGSPLHIWCIH